MATKSGTEIVPGDRILWCGDPATVMVQRFTRHGLMELELDTPHDAKVARFSLGERVRMWED